MHIRGSIYKSKAIDTKVGEAEEIEEFLFLCLCSLILVLFAWQIVVLQYMHWRQKSRYRCTIALYTCIFRYLNLSMYIFGGNWFLIFAHRLRIAYQRLKFNLGTHMHLSRSDPNLCLPIIRNVPSSPATAVD